MERRRGSGASPVRATRGRSPPVAPEQPRRPPVIHDRSCPIAAVTGRSERLLLLCLRGSALLASTRSMISSPIASSALCALSAQGRCGASGVRDGRADVKAGRCGLTSGCVIPDAPRRRPSIRAVVVFDCDLQVQPSPNARGGRRWFRICSAVIRKTRPRLLTFSWPELSR
jgi:hypothetical protein